MRKLLSPASTVWPRLRRAGPVGGGALAVIIIAVGARAGYWFLPFAAGLVIGLAARNRSLRFVLPIAVGVAVAGWAAPLAWQAAHGEPVVATAGIVAALAGLPASAGLVLAATFLVCAIQALAGVWLGRAIRGPAQAGPAAGEQGEPLHMRRFTALCAGYLVSMTGSGLSGFALGVWIYLRTGSATLFAVSMVLTLLPGLLVSPLAGALVDRWSRRMILMISDVAGIASTGVLALLYALGLLQPLHVFIAIAVRSALRSLQVPALNSSVILLAPEKDVGRANGMVLLATAVSQTVAPVLGGVLLLAIKLTGILLIDCATFVVSVGVLVLITIPRPAASAAGSAGRGTLRGEILQGWRYLSRRRGLVGLVTFYSALNVSVGFVDVLFTPLVLGFATAAALGTVLSVGGLGLILGGAAMTLWGGPRRRIHGLAGFAFPLGLCLCLGALRPSVTLIAIAAFGFMFCTMIIDGTSRSILQVEVEPDMQGRTFATFNMVTNFVLLVSYLIAGPVAQHVFDPLLRQGGPLAGSVGSIMGVGPARGAALLIMLLGLLVLVTAATGYLHPSLYRLTARGENGDRPLALSVPEAFPGAATGQVMPAGAAPGIAAGSAVAASSR